MDTLKALTLTLSVEAIQIPTSKFEQGQEFMTCRKSFILDDIDDFINEKNVWNNNVHKCIPSFIDLLRYITGDILIENQSFSKKFIIELEHSNEYIKSISKQHRKLKTQIVDVLDGRLFICDNPKCMQFFSNLLNSNLTVILNDETKSSFDGKFKQNLHIVVNDRGFDYSYKSSMHTEKKYGDYLSKNLADNISIAELRNLFAIKNKISATHLKKQDIIDRID